MSFVGPAIGRETRLRPWPPRRPRQRPLSPNVANLNAISSNFSSICYFLLRTSASEQFSWVASFISKRPCRNTTHSQILSATGGGFRPCRPQRPVVARRALLRAHETFPHEGVFGAKKLKNLPQRVGEIKHITVYRTIYTSIYINLFDTIELR